MPAPRGTRPGRAMYSSTFAGRTPPGPEVHALQRGRERGREEEREHEAENTRRLDERPRRKRTPVSWCPGQAPPTPSLSVMVVKIDSRMLCGMNAATTMTSGKNETNALPASATLRSTNSISSMRSHTCQSRERCARSRTAVNRRVLIGTFCIGFLQSGCSLRSKGRGEYDECRRYDRSAGAGYPSETARIVRIGRGLVAAVIGTSLSG